MKSQSVSAVSSLIFRALAIIVVLSTVGFIAASVICLHLHVLPDGRVVVHNHPVHKDEENGSKHQHTADQYAILTALGNLLQGYDFLIFWAPVSITLAFSWICLCSDIAVSYLVVGDVHTRAPPKVTSVKPY